MTATDAQIRELANTIALQADAIATGKIDAGVLFAHVNLIAHNAATLQAYAEHLKPLPVSQGRRQALAAVAAVEASGVLDGVSRADLDAIDSRPFVKLCEYCGIGNGGHTRNCGRP